jgi:hypothetical protein
MSWETDADAARQGAGQDKDKKFERGAGRGFLPYEEKCGKTDGHGGAEQDNSPNPGCDPRG